MLTGQKTMWAGFHLPRTLWGVCSPGVKSSFFSHPEYHTDTGQLQEMSIGLQLNCSPSSRHKFRDTKMQISMSKLLTGKKAALLRTLEAPGASGNPTHFSNMWVGKGQARRGNRNVLRHLLKFMDDSKSSGLQESSRKGWTCFPLHPPPFPLAFTRRKQDQLPQRSQRGSRIYFPK